MQATESEPSQQLRVANKKKKLQHIIDVTRKLNDAPHVCVACGDSVTNLQQYSSAFAS